MIARDMTDAEAVMDDATQGEIRHVDSEEVDELKVIPVYLPYPARRIIVDRRKFVLMTAPRRLQRGRNYRGYDASG